MAYLFQRIAIGRPANSMGKVGFMKGPTVAPTGKESQNWLRAKALAVKEVKIKRVVDDKRAKHITKIGRQNIGQMLMYFYDPKTKDDLPFYDRFPLIFVIGQYSDGFLGLNLHYLPPLWRAKLMDAIYSTANNKNFDATTRLNLSYKILANTAKMKMFAPCVKRYLYSHVRSNMVVVDPSEWDYAAMLPTARFVKARANKVHADSLTQFSH